MNGNKLSLGRNHSTADSISMTELAGLIRASGLTSVGTMAVTFT